MPPSLGSAPCARQIARCCLSAGGTLRRCSGRPSLRSDSAATPCPKAEPLAGGDPASQDVVVLKALAPNRCERLGKDDDQRVAVDARASRVEGRAQSGRRLDALEHRLGAGGQGGSTIVCAMAR